MVALGVQDAIDAVAGGKKNTENTSHYFTLKNSHDERVKGVSFDQFVELKSNGVFDESYQEKLAALFLQ